MGKCQQGVQCSDILVHCNSMHIEQESANRFGWLVGLSTYYISTRQLGREWNSILAAHIRYVLRLIFAISSFFLAVWLLYNILYRIYKAVADILYEPDDIL
jgi:uncharacterized protein with PQ loop repeat